jgi:TonB family protein
MYFIKKVFLEGKTYEGKVVPEQVVNVPNGVSDDGMKNSSAAPASGNGQTPKIIKTGVINGKALRLVQPDYPPAARAIRATGAVMVEVTLDEQGKVISATAISGHPLLKAAAVEAARKSKFAPVMLDGVPVRVSGVIVYNFAP